ncbi:hypothetical protein DLAC_09083 [Tieghemostelium lacteum]|uniref:Putative restriction endonuclease domain-containing protein n=1 Tax=Tieghemostelium lacteum TaxID=361077 RepID=A0A151Z930_TIELA|nr:hypothetical protein DLAC_09083 [Tieghemostelium lacteum]|eukprot:KYQ90460.1 hypothetical protein DLAC_09083 [Tieghemostelium lacteum]
MNIYNLDKLPTSTIELPWDITIDQYNKFVDLNQLEGDNYKQNSVVIPMATHINFSPLFPNKIDRGLQNQSLNDNPILLIEELNRETEIVELKGSDILWVRDGALIPAIQSTAFLAQVANWNDEKNLGIVASCGYRLLTVSAIYRPNVSFKTHDIRNLDPLEVQKYELTTHPPNFIIEVRSYNPQLNNNNLDIQQIKMVDWITDGAESGVLYDAPGGNVHLYCSTSLLKLQIIQDQIANQQQIQSAQLVPPITNENKPYDTTKSFNQIYFNNMNPVGGYPGISFRTIPLWDLPIPKKPTK